MEIFCQFYWCYCPSFLFDIRNNFDLKEHENYILRHHRQQKKNLPPKGVRLSEKLQLTAALCNEI